MALAEHIGAVILMLVELPIFSVVSHLHSRESEMNARVGSKLTALTPCVEARGRPHVCVACEMIPPQ